MAHDVPPPNPRSIPVFGTLTRMGGVHKGSQAPIPPGNSQIVQVKRSSRGVGVSGRTEAWASEAPGPCTCHSQSLRMRDLQTTYRPSPPATLNPRLRAWGTDLHAGLGCRDEASEPVVLSTPYLPGG